MNKNVWLFTRLSTFSGNDSLKKIMDNCRNKALAKGYTVVNETLVIGSSKVAKAAIEDIIEQNNINKIADCIFSINGNCLSRDLKTAQEMYEYIVTNGMNFESSTDDVALLDKNNPVGAVFNALANGKEQLPDDFEDENYGNSLDLDDESINEQIGQVM